MWTDAQGADDGRTQTRSLMSVLHNRLAVLEECPSRGYSGEGTAASRTAAAVRKACGWRWRSAAGVMAWPTGPE